MRASASPRSDRRRLPLRKPLDTVTRGGAVTHHRHRLEAHPTRLRVGYEGGYVTGVTGRHPPEERGDPPIPPFGPLLCVLMTRVTRHDTSPTRPVRRGSRRVT